MNYNDKCIIAVSQKTFTMITFVNLYLFTVLFILMSNFIEIVYKRLSVKPFSKEKIEQFQSFKKKILLKKNNVHTLVLFQLYQQKNIPLDIIKKINLFIPFSEVDEYYEALVNIMHMYGFYGNHIHVNGRNDTPGLSYYYKNNYFHGGSSYRYFLLQPSPTINNASHDTIFFSPCYQKDSEITQYLKTNPPILHSRYVQIKPGKQLPDLFKPILDEFLPAVEKQYGFSSHSLLNNRDAVCLIIRTYTINSINDIESLLPLLEEVKDKKLKKVVLNQLIIKASCFWRTIEKTSNFVLRKTDTIIMHPNLFRKALEKNEGDNKKLNLESFYHKATCRAKNLTNNEKFTINNVTIYERLGDFAITPTDVGYPHSFVKIETIKIK